MPTAPISRASAKHADCTDVARALPIAPNSYAPWARHADCTDSGRAPCRLHRFRPRALPSAAICAMPIAPISIVCPPRHADCTHRCSRHGAPPKRPEPQTPRCGALKSAVCARRRLLRRVDVVVLRVGAHGLNPVWAGGQNASIWPPGLRRNAQRPIEARLLACGGWPRAVRARCSHAKYSRSAHVFLLAAPGGPNKAV